MKTSVFAFKRLHFKNKLVLTHNCNKKLQFKSLYAMAIQYIYSFPL